MADKTKPGFYSDNRAKIRNHFNLKGPLLRSHGEENLSRDLTVSFFDVLNKVSASLTAQSSPSLNRSELSENLKHRVIRSPRNRIANLMITEDNKLMAVSIFVFDIPVDYLRTYLSGVRELHGNKIEIERFPNLVMFFWPRPLDRAGKIFDFIHYLCFLGPIEDGTETELNIEIA